MTETEISILLLSLRIAFFAALVGLPLAFLAALVLARGNFWGHSILDALVHLPLVLPPVATGYGLLLLFGNNGWIGAPLREIFGISIAFQWTGAALAALIMAFPLMVRPIRIAIEATDRRLEDAAQTMGAKPAMILMTITLPLALPGLIAGLVLGFAKALGEFGATITFVSSIPDETQTLSLAIHNFLQTPNGEESALRLMMISLAIAFSAILLSDLITRRLTRSLGWNNA